LRFFEKKFRKMHFSRINVSGVSVHLLAGQKMSCYQPCKKISSAAKTSDQGTQAVVCKRGRDKNVFVNIDGVDELESVFWVNLNMASSPVHISIRTR
jgi:hypothetical protein